MVVINRRIQRKLKENLCKVLKTVKETLNMIEISVQRTKFVSEQIRNVNISDGSFVRLNKNYLSPFIRLTWYKC